MSWLRQSHSTSKETQLSLLNLIKLTNVPGKVMHKISLLGILGILYIVSNITCILFILIVAMICSSRLTFLRLF